MENQEVVHCKVCKEEINWTNTVTESGWQEVAISCTCEKCFDNLTFNMEENLSELDAHVVSLVEKSPHVVLAGGALRVLVNSSEEELCDYDLFVTDQTVLEKPRRLSHLSLKRQAVVRLKLCQIRASRREKPNASGNCGISLHAGGTNRLAP